MILVVLVVAVVLLVGLLACLLFCWHEPVRRGGYIDLSPRPLPPRPGGVPPPSAGIPSDLEFKSLFRRWPR